MVEDFVNSVQSKEERIIKYSLLRAAGFDYAMARKLRDFRYRTLKRNINTYLNGNTNRAE